MKKLMRSDQYLKLLVMLKHIYVEIVLYMIIRNYLMLDNLG